jgi:glyoxylase-like metal-dependent hydrolase (beta-lactamase superfamily II)
MIIEQILVTGMAVFCYLIGDETTRDGLLIDPAGDFEKIFDKILKHELNIKWIVNSHGHFDHICGNAHMLHKTSAQLLIHKSDYKKMMSRMNKLISAIMCHESSPLPERLLSDGDTIDVGSIRLKVIQTPGHTQGSICLYTDGHVFTGDTLFTEGFGRIDICGNRYGQIMDSIIKKILTLPDSTIIWPGHHYGKYPTSTVREQKKIYLKENAILIS